MRRADPSLERTLALGLVLVAAAVVAPASAARADADGAPDADGEDTSDAAVAARERAPADPDRGFVLGHVYLDPDVELALRLTHLSDVPLPALPSADGGTDPATAGLGQGTWLSSWLRLGGELWPTPELRLVAQLDLFDGVVAGDVTHGVSLADEPRDERDWLEGVEPRWLYAELITPTLVVRAGQMGSHWGLGLLANDGAHPPPFGDYRQGDVVDRLMVVGTPGGPGTRLFLAAAADLVFDDVTARLPDGDVALQAVLALFYERDGRSAGIYAVYRNQTDDDDDHLEVLASDVYLRWEERLGGARVFAALEAALIAGRTTITRSAEHPEQHVRQVVSAAQLGVARGALEATLEVGYASGDADGTDDAVRRATMDPDHRVGLVLFPEVLAAFSARAAAWGSAPELVARPAPGVDALPTHGGVSGAAYLFPWATYTLLDRLDLSGGALLAWSSGPSVDPYRQRAYSENVGWRGGDPDARFLGLELDGKVRYRLELGRLRTSLHVEAGVLVPGAAFDDAAGEAMDPVWLVRGGIGLQL